MKALIYLILCLAFLSVPMAASASDPPRTIYFGDVKDIDPEAYLEHQQVLRRQKLGGVLLGTGFGLAIVGAFFCQADRWGTLGRTGFATTGTGLTIMTSGMFVRSFST